MAKPLERTADREEAEARAEEQRQRAEHEAGINARLRRQKRMLIASLIAASTLLVIVLGLGFLVFRTAGDLRQLQIAASESDERVKGLLAAAGAAQREVSDYYEEAQRLAQAGRAPGRGRRYSRSEESQHAGRKRLETG